MGKNFRPKKFVKEKKQLILKLFEDFKKKRVLVIGDSILDSDVYTEPFGWSLETPTPKLRYRSSDVTYGGAANVVKNILELGARCSFITLLGDDDNARPYENFRDKNLNFLPVIDCSVSEFS